MKKGLLFLFVLVFISLLIFELVNKFAPVRIALISNKQDQGAILGTTDTSGTVVNVRDFGARGDGVTDDTAAIQNALNSSAGRSIFLPKGKYVITSPLTYSTSSMTDGITIIGEGRFNSVFDNRVTDGALLNFTAAKNTFQTGGKLEGFGIITSTKPANSSGISLHGVWQYEINNVSIQGLSGDGIKFASSEGDADSSCYVQINNAYIVQNGGYGIVSNYPYGQNTVANLSVTNSYIVINKAGGVKHTGLTAYFFNNSFAYNTGTGGIYVPYNGIHAQNITIKQNEFDGNVPSQVNIEAIIGLEISMNQVSVNPLDSYKGFGFTALPTEGFHLGKDGAEGYSVRNVHAFLNRFRIDPSANPFTAFAIKANVRQLRILETTWASFGATGQKKFDDYGQNTKIEDESLQPSNSVMGDINRDGKVDIFDYNILLGAFGKT